MNLKELATSVAVVIAGVFIAGFVMNAWRDNETVNKAISGFDA